MKRKLLFSIVFVFIFFSTFTAFSQNIFTKTNANKTLDDVVFVESHLPFVYDLYTININQLKSKIQQVGKKNKVSLKNATTIISIPNEFGKLQQFKILESQLLDPVLAEKYPMIKTYVGQGINDPSATLRLSIAKDGLHIMILRAGKPVLLIDPYTKNREKYILYTSADLPTLQGEQICEFENEEPFNFQQTIPNTNKNVTDGKLRTYDLAIACTIEYSAFHLTNQGIVNGESLAIKKAAVLSAIVNTINRVEGIYEKELAINFNLIANNDAIIFIDSDNFSNNNAGALINESQTEIDAAIGNANYDVGHTFSTGGSGLASLGGICTVNGFGATSRKAKAITGSPNPIGDFYDVDFVAHEMGHHFGANHTYNGQNVGNCTTSNSTTAGEPGSGTTIMAYAGICASLNVQNNSDAYFHTFSLIEINDRLKNTNVLNDFTHPFYVNCVPGVNTGNNEPSANAGLNYIIPKGTAYILEGNGADPDGDVVSFCWEQIDIQQPTVHPLVSTSTVGPAYRSLTPTVNPNRFMPNFETVLDGSLANQWEVTPTVARNLNFRLTTRDNNTDGGQTNADDTLITVNGTAGPFLVTSHSADETWATGETKTITWNIAGTTANGINEANVEILLVDTDGNTLDTLISSTTNDGSENITVPNIVSSSTRIMVKAINNIFYAINDGAITINTIPAYCTTLCNSDGSTQFPDGTTLVQFNTINNTSTGASAYTDYTNTLTDVTVGETYQLIIKTNSDGSFHESTRVWIDWNRDCVFQVATEQYDLGSTFNTPSTGSQTSLSPLGITIPANAELGNTTMRVSSAYSNSGNNPLVYRDSCDTAFFGEVEDYTINIVAPGVCSNNTKTWNGSWSPTAPTIDDPVIIAGNYFSNLNGSFECCTLTVNNNILFTISSDTYVKVKTDIVNNGQFNVNHQGSLVQVEDDATITGNGNYVHTIKTTNLEDAERFTYFSSPNNTNDVSIFNYATANWEFNATTQNWAYLGNNTATTLMEQGKGYAVQGGPGIKTMDFIGAFNNGIVTQPLSFNVYNNVTANYPDPNATDDDSNLVGNPYPSAISANELITNNDISEIHIWTHESNLATNQYTWDDNDYITCVAGLPNGTCTGRVGLNATHNGLIASGQGFFVTATAASDLTFNNAMRSIDTNDQFRNNNIDTNKLWLDFTTTIGFSKQIALTFTENGSLNYDQKYEAKIFGNSYGLDFYSFNNENDKLTINDSGLLNEDITIPLGFVINEESITNATISINHFESLVNVDILLKDNLLNNIHNLQQSNYTFSLTQTGEYNNRFEIIFRNNALGNDDLITSQNKLIVYKENNETLTIKELSGININTIQIYDILGKLLYKEKINQSRLTIPLNINTGTVLIINTTLKNGFTINKKFIY